MFGSLFAKEPEKPAWVDSWRTIYPDETYIAQLGKSVGKKAADDAKANAANAIAQYIQTNVQSELTSSMKTYTGQDEKGRLVTSQEKANSQTINLSVDVTLTSLEFTEPWYNKKEKTWYCVAYVSREKAYGAYKPTVQDSRNKFIALYEKAENEDEPLFKCNYYKTAYNSCGDFISAYNFALLLNPSAVKEDFEQDRKKYNEIPAVVKAIILSCTMGVNVTNDNGNSIQGVVSSVFSELGFVVQENDALYSIEAMMSDNDSIYKYKSKETHTLYPSINLVIKNKSGKAVYTFAYKTEEKTTNFSLETAQRAAFPKFAQEMGPALKTDFEGKLGLSELDLLFN